MFTSEADPPPPTGDEPPFLQEQTQFIRSEPDQHWTDRLTDFVDSRRTPMTLLILAGFIAGVALVYMRQSESPGLADPLIAPAGPTASSSEGDDTGGSPGSGVIVPVRRTASTETTTSSSASSSTPVGPISSTETTATTEASTTSTTEPTTTTEPPTTTASTTTTTEATSPIIELENCFVNIRPNTVVYASHSTSSDQVGSTGTTRGLVQAVAYANFDGDEWYQIQTVELQGWIQENRVRDDTEGQCR